MKINTKQALSLIGILALGFSLSGCGKTEETSGATTFSISGNMTVSSGIMFGAQYSPALDDLRDILMTATACTDGKYYDVYCMSFSASPVAAKGDVTCSGNTGGFTVAGLPIGEPVGCFIRASTTGTDNFKTVGTLEFPALGMGGATDSMIASGDVSFNVSLAQDGTVTVSDVTGVDTSSLATATSDPTTLSGNYLLECKSGTDQFSGACKCMFADDNVIKPYYHRCNNGVTYPNANCWADKDACQADGGAQLPAAAGSIPIDFNVFQGAVSSNVTNGNGEVEMPAGSTIYGVTVWQPNACADGGTCGEAAPTFGGKITWSGSRATNPINWASSVTITTGMASALSADVTLTVPTLPTPTNETYTVSQWHTWMYDFVNNNVGAIGTKYTCWQLSNETNVATWKANAMCVVSFFQDVISKAYDSKNLPKVWAQYNCNTGTCSGTMNEVRVFIEGVHFKYNPIWIGTQANVVSEPGPGISPSRRMVFEKWDNYPNGGGGFRQKNGREEWRSCTTAYSASCTNGGDQLRCWMSEEMAVKFIPTAQTGVVDVVFDKQNIIHGGTIRLNGGGTQDGFAACQLAFKAGGVTFVAKGTKQ